MKRGQAALSETNIEQFLDGPIDPSELSRLGLDFGFLLGKGTDALRDCWTFSE